LRRAAARLFFERRCFYEKNNLLNYLRMPDTPCVIRLRAGLRNINWDLSGFTLAGEASDGEMALSLMQDIQPDILITDVKMPFMDGIELARRTKKVMPWVKIIILSGHDEFEFARQAITIGVDEYLLKPVTSARLFETLKRVAAKTEDEKKRANQSGILNMEDVSVGDLIPDFDAPGASIEQMLRYAARQDISRVLGEYLGKFGNNVVKTFIFLNYMFMDIISSASKIITEHGGDPRRILSEYSGAEVLSEAVLSRENAEKVLLGILEKAIDFRDSVEKSKHGGSIRKAMEHIQQNYRLQGLSLNDVAGAVNISANHFSTIFSQETGETFINYLTGVRIERAKELLKNTKLRLADVAHNVGYNDTHYFSYVFKKNVGLSPREFRAIP
jgi:two-component system response regulator YesN